MLRLQRGLEGLVYSLYFEEGPGVDIEQDLFQQLGYVEDFCSCTLFASQEYRFLKDRIALIP